MSRKTGYLESSATVEENSYNYRVEWDDYITSRYDNEEWCIKCEHHGSGFREVSGFDNAWDMFNDYKEDIDYKGVKLIQIDSDGIEGVYAHE